MDIVVDFKEYGLGVKDASVVRDDTLKALGKRIVNALKTHGYCYLTNHGVDDKLVKRYMEVSRKFFDQPTEEKEKHPLGHDCGFGWLKWKERDSLQNGNQEIIKKLLTIRRFQDMKPGSLLKILKRSQNTFSKLELP